MTEINRRVQFPLEKRLNSYEIDECCRIAESMIEKIHMLEEDMEQISITGKEYITHKRSLRERLHKGVRRQKQSVPEITS